MPGSRDVSIEYVLRVQDQTTAALARLDGRLDQIDGHFQAIGRTSAVAGGTVSGAIGKIGVALAALGLAGVARDAILFGAEFDKSMGLVATTGDEAAANVKRLGREIRDMALRSGQPLNSLARAEFDIISATGDAANSMALLESAMKLAVAGGTDVAVTADGLTTVLNAYSMSGEKASDVSDALFASMQYGKVTVEGLAATLGQVAPSAATAGLKFEELLGAMGAATKVLKPEIAATSLRGFLDAIATADDAQQARARRLAEAAGVVGFEFNTAGLKAQGFANFVRDLSKAINGNKLELEALGVRVESAKAAEVLMAQEGRKVAEVMDLMANRAGLVEKNFAIMQETTSARIDRMRASWDAFKVAFSEGIASAVADAGETIESSSKHMENFGGTLGNLTGAAVAQGAAGFHALRAELLSMVGATDRARQAWHESALAQERANIVALKASYLAAQGVALTDDEARAISARNGGISKHLNLLREADAEYAKWLANYEEGFAAVERAKVQQEAWSKSTGDAYAAIARLGNSLPEIRVGLEEYAEAMVFAAGASDAAAFEKAAKGFERLRKIAFPEAAAPVAPKARSKEEIEAEKQKAEAERQAAAQRADSYADALAGLEDERRTSEQRLRTIGLDSYGAQRLDAEAHFEYLEAKWAADAFALAKIAEAKANTLEAIERDAAVARAAVAKTEIEAREEEVREANEKLRMDAEDAALALANLDRSTWDARIESLRAQHARELDEAVKSGADLALLAKKQADEMVAIQRDAAQRAADAMADAQRRIDAPGAGFGAGFSARMEQIRLELDQTGQLGAAVADKLVYGFGGDLTDAMFDAAAAGESFGDAFEQVARSVVADLAKMIAKQLAYNALAGLLGSVFGIASPSSAQLVAPGSAVAVSGLPLANGGIVTRPTRALIGEAGPEAVIPLDRLPDMKTRGGGTTQHNVFHVNAIDARSFGAYLAENGATVAKVLTGEIGKNAGLRREVRAAASGR